jgi:predicted transcriptional regulator
MTRAFARNSDPDTSHDAGRSIDDAVTYLEQTVLDAVRTRKKDGCTLDELIDILAMDKVTISPRLRPLCNKGLVIENGKRMGKSNRKQTIWLAIEYYK